MHHHADYQTARHDLTARLAKLGQRIKCAAREGRHADAEDLNARYLSTVIAREALDRANGRRPRRRAA